MLLIALNLALISLPVAPDKAAHFGVSYAMTHSCQVAAKNLLNMSKFNSTLVCAAGVAAIGAAKEVSDPYTGGQRDGKDFIADALGIGLAVTVINLDF